MKPAAFPRLHLPIRLLRLALYLRMPSLVAVALVLLSRNKVGRGSVQLLALQKDQFEEDVAVLPRVNSAIQLRPLSLYYLKMLFSGIAPEPLEGLAESNYHLTSKWATSKNAYYSFLMRTLPIFCRLTGVRGIISCNHNYIAQQELSRACEALSVPFFVVLKEGMIVPEREKDWHEYYSMRYFSGPLNASAVYTANAYVAHWIANSPSIDNKSELVPVGIPRTDHYKTDKIRQSSGTALVVFAYDPVFSFRYFSEVRGDAADPEFETRLAERTVETYGAILEFARRNPGVPVIIKSKPRSLVERAILPKLSEQREDFGALPNFTLTNTVAAAELIKQARIVIALNSTTVAEAIMSRRTVLTPDFDDFFNGRPWNYFHRFEALYNPFSRAEEIEAAMASEEIMPEEAARHFVERQLTSDSVLASETLAKEIIDYLGRAERGAVLQDGRFTEADRRSLETS